MPFEQAKIIDESGLYHQTKSSWCTLSAPQTLHLTLRTKAHDLEQVSLFSFPSYGAGQIEYPARPLELILSDQQYDYYQIRLTKIPVKRFAYCFKLHKKGLSGEFCYTEMGLYSLSELLADKRIFKYAFKYPYFNKIDIHTPPEWATGAVGYQIFPDRFARSSARSKKALPWGTPPDRDIMIGGDLPGIISRLDHLVRLGVDFLYMTPIFKAHSNHKYDTIDYKEIDPAFGSNEDFRRLVEACHARGIKLILDAVFNHCGPGFAPFADVQEQGEKSQYKDWFHILRFPIPHYKTLVAEIESKTKELQAVEGQQLRSPALGTDGQTTLAYETFAYNPMMPKLNTENPALKEYLLEVAEYWISEYDIDGWRLDVANELDHHFWREFRQRVLAVKNDVLIVGEIWHNAHAWLQGDQFDCVMNYPFQNISFDFFLHKSINAAQAKKAFNALLLRYTPQVNQVQWNMLDSHDTARLLYSCAGSEQKVILLLSMAFSYIGTPIIYYGSELGLDGGEDPDCRRCMPWDESTWNKNIYATVQKLIRLRKDYKVFRSGQLSWLPFEHPDLIAFKRFDFGTPADRRIILLNRAAEPLLCSDFTGAINLLTGEAFTGELAPYGAYIF